MEDRKPIVWMGSSRRDLVAMPEAVRKDFGGALHAVQEGRQPEGAKPLKGKVRGAVQLSEDDDGDTYRAVYTVELESVVYVLHCFQKKSKSGTATPQADVDLIERRPSSPELGSGEGDHSTQSNGGGAGAKRRGEDAKALHAQRNRKQP